MKDVAEVEDVTSPVTEVNNGDNDNSNNDHNHNYAGNAIIYNKV